MYPEILLSPADRTYRNQIMHSHAITLMDVLRDAVLLAGIDIDLNLCGMSMSPEQNSSNSTFSNVVSVRFAIREI